MLKTEMRNEASMHIDQMDTLSIIRLINQENRNAVEAVEAALEGVALACDAIAAAFDRGGRLFYIGAGTSGRLGVIDAAECPPTFGVPSEQVVGIIAGGERCLAHAAEAQEDDGEAGIKALQDEGLTEKDVVVGISSSGEHTEWYTKLARLHRENRALWAGEGSWVEIRNNAEDCLMILVRETADNRVIAVMNLSPYTIQAEYNTGIYAGRYTDFMAGQSYELPTSVSELMTPWSYRVLTLKK